MQIVIKNDNKESIYEMIFDEQNIRNLIDEIIENCSFRKKGRYVVYARSKEAARIKIENEIFWKEIKTYEKICDFRAEDFHDPNNYWRPGDPRPFSFEAEAIVAPELVYYLMNILKGENIDYNWFVNREELHKKEKIKTQIQKIDSEINHMSNFNWETKIKMLEELGTKVKHLNELPNFDNEILDKYYSLVENSIKLELLQETIKYSKKLLKTNSTDIN